MSEKFSKYKKQPNYYKGILNQLYSGSDRSLASNHNRSTNRLHRNTQRNQSGFGGSSSKQRVQITHF